ncbi:MAG: Do family serine endopeptidase [Planctomycetes bacterium]|nr:Do family serine endopeptidase [Planctomycetota bacterium]
MKTTHWILALVLAALTASSALNLRLLADESARTPAGAPTETPEHLDRVLAALEESSKAFVAASRRVSPCVVHVTTVQRVREGMAPDPFFDDFFHDEMFRRFLERRFPQRDQERRALGSGVIVRGNGTILTNNHVVQGATRIEVTLADRRTFEAERLGADPKSDLAVLRLRGAPDGLPAAQLGDSDAIEVGQWVVAIGNPFGLDQTVTAGIISAKGRSDVGVAEYEDFLQTDAAINPGNSGGPLVDLRGRVIAINSAIASRSGGYQGIGFAIPSNMARAVLESILEHGEVRRGWLGVTGRDLTPEEASHAGLAPLTGAGIESVQAGTPAAGAGLAPGDIVASFDGREIRGWEGLRNAIALIPPGRSVPIVVVRDGERRTLTATIRDRDEVAAAATGESTTLENLGVTLTAISTEHPASDLPPGLLVTAVKEGGLAEGYGIRPGAIVVSVNGTRVATIAALRDALNLRRDGFALRVWQEGAARDLLFSYR